MTNTNGGPSMTDKAGQTIEPAGEVMPSSGVSPYATAEAVLRSSAKLRFSTWRICSQAMALPSWATAAM